MIAALGGQPADVVLSDMAAPTTGHRQTDHLRTMHLCETAADFAASVLKPGGHFVAKVFRGGTEGELLARLKRDFTSLHHVKPPASRAAVGRALSGRPRLPRRLNQLAAGLAAPGAGRPAAAPTSPSRRPAPACQNEITEAKVSTPTVSEGRPEHVRT